MPTSLHLRRLATVASISAALSVSVIAPASAEFVRLTPWVRVTIPSVINQAQLAAQLSANGYTDILLTPINPNPATPVPELIPTWQMEQTPVHRGWNGTALRTVDGRRVWVRVTYGPEASVVPMIGFPRLNE